jgi:pantothenate kinase type III
MENFLIDIGNSAIKVARTTPGSLDIHGYRSIIYKKDHLANALLECISSDIGSGRRFSNIGVSLVNKENKWLVKKVILDKFGINPEFVGLESNLPFKLLYSRTIGTDRLCSSAAAYNMTRKNTVLTIDFGTATTYTVISESSLIGGLISPGVGTSYNALIAKTSLPNVNLKFPAKIFCKSTEENIRAGVLYQTLFATERIINETKKSYGGTFVIATGGYSKLICDKTKLIDKADPYLVLKGINILISS